MTCQNGWRWLIRYVSRSPVVSSRCVGIIALLIRGRGDQNDGGWCSILSGLNVILSLCNLVRDKAMTEYPESACNPGNKPSFLPKPLLTLSALSCLLLGVKEAERSCGHSLCSFWYSEVVQGSNCLHFLLIPRFEQETVSLSLKLNYYRKFCIFMVNGTSIFH